jgi:hypothetical protein
MFSVIRNVSFTTYKLAYILLLTIFFCILSNAGELVTSPLKKNWIIVNPIRTLAHYFFKKLTVAQLLRKFANFFWNYEAHYRVHESPLRLSIWEYMNPVHTPLSYLLVPLSCHLYIFVLEVASSLQVSDQNFVWICYLNDVCYMPRPSHASWFDCHFY